jgi:hypothetical protein
VAPAPGERAAPNGEAAAGVRFASRRKKRHRNRDRREEKGSLAVLDRNVEIKSSDEPEADRQATALQGIVPPPFSAPPGPCCIPDAEGEDRQPWSPLDDGGSAGL